MIEVFDRTGRAKHYVAPLRSTLAKAARLLRHPKSEVCLVLVNDPEIRRLNRKFRRKNRPTDVLSFGENPVLTFSNRFLGDIVISLPTARRQAKKAAKPIRSELRMLAVHGLLHLLGHDHEKPAEARTMFQLQDELLRKTDAR